MPSNHPTVLAVVNQFPARSQTFIERKLTGLRDAGIGVTVAASEFGDAAPATGFDLLPLTPWHRPAASFGRNGRAGWAAVARGLRVDDQPGEGPWRLTESGAFATGHAEAAEPGAAADGGA